VESVWKEHISQFVQLKEWSVYKNKGQIICASPPLSISPDNREYTVVPTILLESPKGPNDEKCLGPTNPFIRFCQAYIHCSTAELHAYLWETYVSHAKTTYHKA
jgi:hypothetical protein